MVTIQNFSYGVEYYLFYYHTEGQAFQLSSVIKKILNRFRSFLHSVNCMFLLSCLNHIVGKQLTQEGETIHTINSPLIRQKVFFW